jgi:hypothetical protein
VTPVAGRARGHARRWPGGAALRLGVAALAVVLLLLPGGSTGAAQGVEPAASPEPDAEDEAVLPLVLLLATDRPSYGPGSPVIFTIAVDNPSTAPVTVAFSSAQLYDIAVRAGGSEVWRWSDGRAFAAALTERDFPPGVTLLGRERWDRHDAVGVALPSGQYQIVGTLTTVPPASGNVLALTLTAS